jgi:hypothetical protein
MDVTTQPSSHPGQMTALMRAARPEAGPKVLHVARVERGRMLDERVLERGEALSIGPTERSTFLVDAPGLETSRRLIEPKGEGWVLHLDATMRGQIALIHGLADVQSLLGEGPVTTLPLDPSSRGKLVIGSTVLLFHFVDPPIRSAKPELPLAVRQRPLDMLDWKTTFIAAFSFLAHFGAVGAIYSDWSDPIVDDAIVIGQTLDAIRDLPRPAVEMRDDSPPDQSESPSSTADARTKNEGPTHGGPKGGPSNGASAGENKGLGDAAATKIARELAQMDGLMTLGLRGPGRGVDGVLEQGNLPIGIIDDLAQSNQGIGPGNVAGLHLGEGPSGVVRPGMARERGLPRDTAVAQNQGDTGKATTVKKPVGNTLIGGPIPTGGIVPNANAVVASGKAGFRACYKRAIDEDPTMHGSVRITAKIGPNGEVSSASASGASGLSPALVGCLVGRVRGLQFEPPQGGGATLIIPMGFEVQPQ